MNERLPQVPYYWVKPQFDWACTILPMIMPKTHEPQTWPHKAPDEELLKDLSRWRRFKYAFVSEIRWKPSESWRELSRVILLGVPVLWLLNLAATLVGNQFGFQAGMDSQPVLDMLEKNPVALLALGALFAPLFEEFFFRVLPRTVGRWVRPSAVTMWPLGIVCTLLFALAHINPDNPTIPLPQFLTGLALWAMQARFGYLGSVALHACFNGSLLLPAVLLAGKVQ
ncbi:MAG: membrane protease YdiL (CAAX protease family) [Planctomycetota bacterium]|jgi:membrane protease YdiL (CAAX protease family)